MVLIGKIIIALIILPAVVLFGAATGAGIFYVLNWLWQKWFKN